MSSPSQKKINSPRQKRKRSSPTKSKSKSPTHYAISNSQKPLKKRIRLSPKKSSRNNPNLETVPNPKLASTKSLSPITPVQQSPKRAKRESPLKFSAQSQSNKEYLAGNYSLIRKLGEGTYGTVYLALDDKTGRYVAVKIFKHKPSRQSEKTDFDKEIFFGNILKQNKNCYPFVVCLLDEGRIYDPAVSSHIRNFIAYELMDGDLEQYQFGSLHEILQCLLDISKGLQWMHEKMLAHGDVKPANLLFKKNALIDSSTNKLRTIFKVGDIGGACSINSEEPDYEKYQGVVSFGCKNMGTLSFIAPEILTHFQHRNTYLNIQKADIWSLGITFFFLVQKFFFPRKDENKLFPYSTRKGQSVPYGQEILESNIFGHREKIKPLAQHDLALLNLNSSKTERTASYIIDQMIRVNPAERIPLSQAIRELEAYFIKISTRYSDKAEDYLL